MRRFSLAMKITLASLILGTCASAPATAAASTSPTLSGVYTGPANVSGIDSFASWLGAPPAIVGDFTGDSSWSALTNPGWLLNGLAPISARGTQLTIDLPLLVQDEAGSFQAGAEGAYDQYFESFAQQAVAAGDGSAIIRLGGEFNGSWEPYALAPSGPDSAPYFIAYWRHLVDLFRSVPGANFTFDWCTNIGIGTSAPDAAYPGDDYVDYVGVDVYDYSWSDDGGPTGRWQAILNEPYGLNWWNDFAQAHGKPMSIPEWGVVTSGSDAGGDDPYFIEQMHQWISANHPAYEVYFDYGDSSLSLPSAAQSAAAYQQLFGSAGSSTPSSGAGPSSAGSSQPGASPTRPDPGSPTVNWLLAGRPTRLGGVHRAARSAMAIRRAAARDRRREAARRLRVRRARAAARRRAAERRDNAARAGGRSPVLAD